MPAPTQPAPLKRSPLSESLRSEGAVTQDYFGWEAVAHFGSPEDEARLIPRLIRGGVGLADWSWLPKFEIQGQNLDAAAPLPPSARAWRLARDRYLITCSAADREAVESQLVRDSQPAPERPSFYVTEVTSAYAALLLAGPRSTAVLRKLADLDLSGGAFPNHSCQRTGIAHVPVTLLRDDFGGLQAYLLLCGREYGEWLWSTVSRAGEEFGMQPFGLSAREQLTRERPAGEPLSGAGT